MVDQYIRRIGEGIYVTELDGPRNKIKEIKRNLDNYIDMIQEDMEYDQDVANVKENERKMELIIHIIEKLNEFIIRDSS